MKRFVILVLTVVVYTTIQAQPSGFSKYPVMESGMSVFMPDVPEWSKSYSEDGSEVYSAEVFHDNNYFSAIIVKLLGEYSSDKVELSGLLEAYIDFLCESILEIENIPKKETGLSLDARPEVTGIYCYGTDIEGIEYKIKGWINSTHIAVMIVTTEDNLSKEVQDFFLNGVIFGNQ
jgi:hypothetical protein